MEYNILSPDNITISPEWFKTEGQAWNFFAMWKKSFQNQGHYSSNSGNILLGHLKDACTLVDTDNFSKIIAERLSTPKDLRTRTKNEVPVYNTVEIDVYITKLHGLIDDTIEGLNTYIDGNGNTKTLESLKNDLESEQMSRQAF